MRQWSSSESVVFTSLHQPTFTTLLWEHLVWELLFLLCAVYLIVIPLKCDTLTNIGVMREIEVPQQGTLCVVNSVGGGCV